VKANARERVMPELKFEPIKPALPVARIMFYCAVRGVYVRGAAIIFDARSHSYGARLHQDDVVLLLAVNVLDLHGDRFTDEI
jgi:hypothetical protein